MQAFAQVRLPLAFHPASGFRYSVSTDLLDYIIRLASGQLFDEFLKERIFAPRGMLDADFWASPEKVGFQVPLYGLAEGEGLEGDVLLQPGDVSHQPGSVGKFGWGTWPPKPGGESTRRRNFKA